jgi:Ni/Co efflux regulator RcnB
MKSHFALALVLVTIIPATALAQSQDEQQACMNDAFTVCGNAIPDRDRVAACLAQNINRISPACRTVMARYPKPGTTPVRRERVIEQDDRYDRGDRFYRNDQFDRRDRYGRY